METKLSIYAISERCKLSSWRVCEFLDREVLEASGYTAEQFLLEVHDLMCRRLENEYESVCG